MPVPLPVEPADASASTGASNPGEVSAVSASPSFSPLYRQIKALVLASLQRGQWKPGEMIPSEFDLAALYRVSQGTVRKAVDELAAENLLVRRQGRGTFVATHTEQHVQYRFLRLQPDDIQAQLTGMAPKREFLSCRRVRASADVARALALRTADPVLQARRVLRFHDTPVILEDLWLPAGPFKGLTAERLAQYHGPMYAMFESEFGVRMVRADEKIRAVLPDQQQAKALGVDCTTPLLSVERIAYTYHDLPMELRRGLYRTDSHHYRNELG